MSWHPLSPKVQAANKIIAEQEFAENMRTYQSKRENSQAAAQAITAPYTGPNFRGVKPTPPARVTITEDFNLAGAKENPNRGSALHDFESRFPAPEYEVQPSKPWERVGTKECKVSHPNHYTQGKFECIEVLQENLSAEAFLGFLQGNVTKYLWRWKDKNGLEDLKKAQWYLNKMVESV